jgi:hypothetical protein
VIPSALEQELREQESVRATLKEQASDAAGGPNEEPDKNTACLVISLPARGRNSEVDRNLILQDIQTMVWRFSIFLLSARTNTAILCLDFWFFSFACISI